jgi:hypothetical protein
MGEQLMIVMELSADVESAVTIVHQRRADREVSLDVYRAPVCDRELSRHRREAVPGREQTGRFVERRGDEAAVDEPRPRLVLLTELKSCLV